MKIKKMKNSKTTKKKWEYEMKKKEPLQCWIVNIMSSRNPFYEMTIQDDASSREHLSSWVL